MECIWIMVEDDEGENEENLMKNEKSMTAFVRLMGGGGYAN